MKKPFLFWAWLFRIVILMGCPGASVKEDIHGNHSQTSNAAPTQSLGLYADGKKSSSLRFKKRRLDLEVFGHRGSAGTNVENTIPAFREADASGANFMEFDIQLSGDNIPVVSHDPTISSRLCTTKDGIPVPSPLPIRNMTYDEIDDYDCGGHTSQPSRIDRHLISPSSFHPLPTFEQVLNWHISERRQVRLAIDVKMPSTSPGREIDPYAFTAEIIRLLNKYELKPLAYILSLDDRIMKAAAQIDSSIPRVFLISGVSGFCDAAVKAQANHVGSIWQEITSDEVEKCHQNNMRVFAWTSDTVPEWNGLIAAKVDGIITDFPRRMVLFLISPPKH